MEEDQDQKVIKINEDTCIGCGTCEGIAPDYFKVEDGLSKVIKDYSETDNDFIEEAVNSCPVQAISVVKKTEEE